MINSDTKPWYRQFWPWFIMALPATAVVACFYTIYLILHHPLSMVEKNYYEEGLTINKNMAEVKLAKTLGLQARIQLQEDHRFQISLTATEAFLLPDTLTLQFDHPVNDSKDLAVTLLKDKDSYHSAAIPDDAWQLLNTEMHWYVYLRSPVQGKSEWILQGETRQAPVRDLMLDSHQG